MDMSQGKSQFAQDRGVYTTLKREESQRPKISDPMREKRDKAGIRSVFKIEVTVEDN